MKKIKGLKIIAFIILGIAFIYILLPYHLKIGVMHLTPNIDDYKIFQNRFVMSDVHQPWLLADDYNTNKLDPDYLKIFNELETVSFLVIQDGKIKYEQYWNEYDQNSYSNSFSMAKTIVSLLIGIALDEGKIKSLDDPVGDYLKEFETGENSKLKIKDLLTMSSGLNWDEAYASPFSKTTKAYYGKNLRKLHLELEVVEEPGSIFKYYSCNTQLLAFILEEVTDMKISQYASEKLWKPLGAKHDALWSIDQSGGDEKAYCCFNSNAKDFARLGQLVLNEGKWNNHQIISADYIKAMTTPASNLTDLNGESIYFYGYHIWLLEYRNMKIPYFRGILGQFIFVIPEKNTVIVRLGEKRSFEKVGVHTIDVITYLDAAMKIID